MTRIFVLGLLLTGLFVSPAAAFPYRANRPAAIPQQGPSVLGVPYGDRPSVLGIPQRGDEPSVLSVPPRPLPDSQPQQIFRQPVWVQPQWMWNGWQWVWVQGYWD